MIGRAIPLFKLLGFQISIDLSWFLLAILITWSLATGLFPAWYKGLQAETYWLMGASGALGLFASIVLHELGHSVAARRFGIQMRGITLFIFGGVAEMTREPPSARAEFVVAIAGPIVSVGLSAGMIGLAAAGRAMEWPVSVTGVVGYLGWINMILVIFNMIPAFPLDGGRVLRAGLWHIWDDLRRATRVTAGIGSAFGVVLIVLGITSAIFGNLIAGIWWFVLGLFLRGAANMSYQQVLLRRAFEGEPVARFMRADPVTVDPRMTIREFVDEIVYTHQHKMYPVVEGDRLIGCVTREDVKRVPREEWEARLVGEILSPCTRDNTVEPHVDAMDAFARLQRTGSSRLMVVEDGRLVGVLALKDLMGLLSLKIDLEGEDA